MGALIHLTPPVQAGPDASRVYYAVGRSLSASDFAQQSRYVDARLLGLTPRNLGVISGLGVSPARYDSAAASPSPQNFTVAPGAGIGADGRLVRLTTPLSFSWQELLQTMTPANTIVDGVYLLLLRTLEFDGVDGPPPDASADAGGDPLLDIRQDSFVELSLSASIGALPPTLTAPGVAFGLNSLIGGLSPQSLAAAIGAGVPIALVMSHGNQLLLLSQAAGRVAADPKPLEALLLAETREALQMALNELGANATADDWGPMTQRFRFLPGACELPLSMLTTSPSWSMPTTPPSSFTPSVPFLPSGVAVYFQIIPLSQTTNLLTEALGRPPIDLTNIDGPAVTLSLAVPDASWSANLIDEPLGDPILPADLHFAYARARDAQAAWLQDWVALYGGMTAAPVQFPQEIAFLVDADGAAQNISYLLTIGAISTQNLIDAAAAATPNPLPPAAPGTPAPTPAPSSPPPFLPIVTGWLSALTAANATATQTAAAAVASAAATAYAANAAGTSPAASAAAAGQAAAFATVTPAPVPGSVNAAVINAVCAAMASAATALIAAAYPGTATLASVQAAASALAAPVALPTLQNATTIAPQLLANLGYQVLASDPEPAQPTNVPVPSDSLLNAAKIYPAAWIFAAWLSAISAPSPDSALLQPLIDAGVISANPTTQAQEISTFLALIAASGTAIDDTQPGALLHLATAQLFYAVLGRVARAQEYRLDAHSRLIALQRQHLDMMSTYVSAVAGGVPPDGSGLSITKIIPYINLTPPAPPPSTPSPSPPPPPTYVPANPGFVGRFTATRAALEPAQAASAANTTQASRLMLSSNSATLASAQTRNFANLSRVSAPALNVANANQVSAAFAPTTFTSQVASASVGAPILSNPVISNIGSMFGSQSDIAKSVAAQTSAVSQGPQFLYSPVSYGLAGHITPGATLFQSAQTGLSGLRTLMGKSPISITPTALAPTAANTWAEADYYDGVMRITRCLLSDIAQVENNAIKIEASYTMLRDRLNSLETLISQLSAAVGAARDAMRAAQSASGKAAGDYAAAQSLLNEEVTRVNAAVQARDQAIAAATGLFMVRELQTVIARDPPAMLSLTADTPEDLAPACLTDHPGPPASLTPFLNLLLETPLINWRPLIWGWTELPDNSGLQRLSGLRVARLANFAPSTNFGSGAAASDLAKLAASARSVIDPVLRSTFTLGSSLALNQQMAFSVFSLPDLMTLPANPLRADAESLRDKMESATGCLYETLIGLPPSARFVWAELARAGNLPALSFMQWPLPATPTAATTTALRQLSALVTWMTAQLADGAHPAAQTALSNLVSAAVIASAYGDPNEAVSGAVVSTGGVPRPGLPIRITLNRPPPIGTVLNMFDDNQNIVGTLRVQDHDAYGTSATVVTSFAKTTPSANWTVASPKGRSPWLPS